MKWNWISFEVLFLLWIDVVDDLNRDKNISFYRRWRNMNKKLKHLMIYAAIVIFTLTCGFCAIWNFMYCKDMLVCIIIIGYFMTMLLFSDRIEKGLSWDPFLCSVQTPHRLPLSMLVFGLRWVTWKMLKHINIQMRQFIFMEISMRIK